MTSILGTIALTLFFGIATWMFSLKEALDRPKLQKNQSNAYIIALLIIGFIIRVICAVMYKGHETDMGCFMGWSTKLFNNGLGNFYLSEGFHDYPPGYVYIMYILGAIKDIFSIVGKGEWLLIKMPSILADLGIGYFIYRVARKTYGNNNGAALAALFVINPVVILNSSLWGQVDSILALPCLLSVYYISQKKYGKSFFAFVAGFLIKPQAVFFAPVIAFALIEDIFVAEGFKKDVLIDVIKKGLIAIVAMFILFMPFGNTPFHGIEVIVNQYIETMKQYNYLTVNAFNLYAAFGGNWEPLSAFMSVFGYLMIAVVVAFSGMIFFRSSNSSRYYICSAIIVFGVYMLSVKMHERYAFPAIVVLMMALATMPTTKNFMAYILFSMSQFFNIAWILFVYEKNPGAFFRSGTVTAASFINIALFGWMMYQYYKEAKGSPAPIRTVQTSKAPQEKKGFSFQISEKVKRIAVVDIVAILVISIVYGGVAFYKLGNAFAPETEVVITNNPVKVDFGEEVEVGDIAFYLGARHLYEERNLKFDFLNKDNQIVYNENYTDGSVFVWNHKKLPPVKAQYVVISSDHRASETDPSDLLFLREVVILDENGDCLPIVNISRKSDVYLFDEQDYFDGKNYMAGTYFDEIYHARTAYEFLEGMSVYEWTHPPLGKLLMGIGIWFCGMVPLGWRVVGTTVGVLMVAVIYLLSKRVVKYPWLAVALTLLFTFDFMHFTQTRLATIDTYIVFFIMLMYYYMYKYYKMSFYDTPLKKTLIPLGLSGIFFGLGVASKWTGMYAGAGLAIIFFITLWRRYQEFKYAKRLPKGETDGISHKTVIETFKNNTITTLVFCCIAFVAVPFVIYALSYIPYMNTPSGEGLKTIFTNAESMLTYHGRTVANSTHPYSSFWFEWPVMYRPIYYFSNTLENGMKQGISAFGNPAVWWIGIGALAYTLAVAIIMPLSKKNFLGKSKSVIGGIYAGIFAIITILSYISASGDEKLVRFPKIMLLYSVIFIAIFVLVLMYENRLKNISHKTALFLVIGFFAQLLPWTLVLRTTYIYHYFTCIPFVVLMIGFVIKSIYDNVENKKSVIAVTFIYVAVAVGLFILFYPVLSGAPVSAEFANEYLKWFSSWVLVS